MSLPSVRTSTLAILALVVACDAERTQIPPGVSAQSFKNSDWSTPVRLDAPVNSPTANEQAPALSSDGLAVYFCSNRPGGSGGNDLWASRRASEDDPWETPVNLGPGVNSPGGDCGPSLSVDGLLLFFTSNRTGGTGGNDLYMASRTDPADELGWGAPVPLGPEVNTAATEFSPFITKRADDQTAELYFERGSSNVATDIYVVTIDAQGIALGPAVAVAEVNSDGADGRPTVRFDGREMLLHSSRDGGSFYLFVSTRQSPNHPWSMPVALNELNASQMHEIHPYLSKDGRMIFFIRGTGVANDIWMSARSPSGH